jgi:thermospermine synthase
MCKEFLPDWSAGTFDDKRAKVIIDDAKGQLEGFPDGYFDVIILDLSDPLDGGPCYQLYTTSFYETCKAKLNDGGVFVTQSGCGGIADAEKCFTCVHSTLKQVTAPFPHKERLTPPRFLVTKGGPEFEAYPVPSSRLSSSLL